MWTPIGRSGAVCLPRSAHRDTCGCPLSSELATWHQPFGDCELCETHAVLRGAVVLVVLVAAACGGGSDGDDVVTVGSVVDATRSANTARLRMELSLAAGDGPSTLSEGVVDFDSGDSETRNGPLGSDLGDDAMVARTVGDEVFVGTGDEDSLWVRLPPPPAGADAVLLRLDPVSIADELAHSSGDLTESGSSEVRGDPTTVYRLDLPNGSDLLPLLAVPADASVTATMEVDTRGRLRRLVAEPDDPGPAPGDDSEPLEFPVPERSELMLWDFGIDVHVEEPPTDAIVDFDDPRAGEVFAAVFDWAEADIELPRDEPESEMPVRSGPFALISEGQWEEVTWEVWQAPATGDSVCHSVNLQPPPYGGVLGQVSSEASVPGSSESPGAWSSCGPKADLFERGDPVQVITGWSRDADYWSMLGTAAPEISSLRVVLTDGGTIDVPVDPATHVFALFRRAPLSIDKVIPDAGSNASIECEPEETEGFGVSYLNCSGTVRRS
jgi:hypothetical protein